MNRLCCPILILLLTLSMIASNNLFFGVTHSGKSALINAACGLNLPVAETNQMYSTTDSVTVHDCLGSKVTDTIGLFDYTNEKPLRVNEVLKMILGSVSRTGISSVVWAWSSKATSGNKELEDVFKTLRSFLPSTVPISIVYNHFPASTSGVPEGYSKKFNIPLLTASITNANQVAKWIKDHTVVYRVELPANYEDYLLKHDIDGLRKEMQRLSLLSCDVVNTQIDAINAKLQDTKPVSIECNCDQNCERCEKRCRYKAFGKCMGAYNHCWQDQGCHDGVRNCYDACKQTNDKAQDEFKALKARLEKERDELAANNAALLRACLAGGHTEL